MRILSIIGARPQMIKAAVLSKAILETRGLEQVLLHTGQHFDSNMSDIFFEELGIPSPDLNLGIAGGSHGAMTGRMLEAIERSIFETKPDVVLVYGDTNSTLAGAIAAAKLNIPVAHVEAGLRSFNRKMPEEVNRVLADHVSEWLFTPTDRATQNLAREGIVADKVFQVGDVMFDTALFFAPISERVSGIRNAMGLESKNYVLATVHRQENTDDGDRLRNIFDGLKIVSETIPVVVSLHPRTKKKLLESGTAHLLEGLVVIEPVGYLDMINLERNAAVVATDSGGVQKESYFYGVPCVTLRDETEWVELVEMGWNTLASPRDAAIAETVLGSVGRVGITGAPYGTGDSARRIVDVLAQRA